MPGQLKHMRYAHTEGHTDLCYDDKGKYLLTCGTDGDIRVWDGFEDDDPVSHHMGDCVYAVAFKNDKIYVGSDTNSVQVFTFPQAEPDGIITRFTSPVNHICCSADGKTVVAGAGDFMIKVVNNDGSHKLLQGHEAPVLGIALDPRLEYVASSSCDGTVCLWRISDQQCIKKWSLLPKCNDFCTSKTLCRLQWHPREGKYLAVPVDKEIKIYQRNTWECNITLKDDCITEMLSIVTYSPCGSYLAAASVNGSIVIWDTTLLQCLERHKHEKDITICSLAWNPSDKKELMFCDVQGQLGVVENIGSSALIQSELPNVGNDEPYSELPVENDNDTNFKVNLNNENREESDDEISVPGIKAHKSRKLEDDDEFEIDIGAIKASLEPKIFGEEDSKDEVLSNYEEKEKPPSVPVGPPPTPIQVPFQPGSTPVHLQQRFMVWNTVGAVRCYNTEDENSIDVEFHDTSVHHAIRMDNTLNHTMASLSQEALLLACEKEESTSSKLVCMHFGTWDSNKEWSLEMPDDEQIEAITLGAGWAAAATDTRLIRLFTISGVQLEVFAVPGPVVCLTSHEKMLAVVYHQGAGVPGDQNLAVMLFKVGSKKQPFSNSLPLPLSPKSFLAWLGFTDEGTLCAVDTQGIVRLLYHSMGNKWFPVCNSKTHTKGKSDHYFIVGVTEIQQQVRCIPCKGSRYPPILPRPAVTVLPLQLPLCEMSNDKGRFEEEYWRSHYLHNLLQLLSKDGFEVDSEIVSTDRKKTDILLRMFALATRTDREFRAMQIAEIMPSYRAVQGAIRYASQRHHMALAEKLGEVAQQKLIEESGYSSEMENASEEDEPIRNKPLQQRMSDNWKTKTEEAIIQPKPLSVFRNSLDFTERNSEHHQESSSSLLDDSSEEKQKNKDESQYLLSSNPGQKNPFRINLQPKQALNGIDNILEESAKKYNSPAQNSDKSSKEQKKKGVQNSKQSKLFAKSEKSDVEKDRCTATASVEKSGNTKSGFQLYLEENKPTVLAENPDMEEKEVVKLLVQKFKELPPSDKTIWNNKASPDTEVRKKRKQEQSSVSVDKNGTKGEDIKKVKLTEKEKQRNLSEKTTSKLSNFAFFKKE